MAQEQSNSEEVEIYNRFLHLYILSRVTIPCLLAIISCNNEILTNPISIHWTDVLLLFGPEPGDDVLTGE